MKCLGNFRTIYLNLITSYNYILLFNANSHQAEKPSIFVHLIELQQKPPAGPKLLIFVRLLLDDMNIPGETIRGCPPFEPCEV